MIINRYQTAERVALAGVVGNSLLTILQVGVGVLAGSRALLANGMHTGVDIMAALAIFVGMRVASQPADFDHPYGHARAETIVQKIVAILVILAGLEIGWLSLSSLLSASYATPGLIALGAAAAAIAVKETLYRYTSWAARTTGNKALAASAMDHRADVFASVATLVGVGGAHVGFPFLDPLMGVGISLMILWGGIKMAADAVEDLMDGFNDQELLGRIRLAAAEVAGVREINSLRARKSGPYILVDLEIGVDAAITVEAGHRVAEEVRAHIFAQIQDVTGCMVHVNPVGEIDKGQ